MVNDSFSLILTTLIILLVVIPVLVKRLTSFTHLFLLGATLLVIIALYLHPQKFEWLHQIALANLLWSVLISIPISIAFWVLTDLLLTPLIEKVLQTETNYERFSILRNNIALTAKSILSIWLTAAIAEELIFRGYFLELSLQKSDFLYAMIGTAALFSAIHVYQGLSGLIVTFVSGLLLNLLYIKSNHNLILLIAVHGISDSLFFITVCFNLDRKLQILKK